MRVRVVSLSVFGVLLLAVVPARAAIGLVPPVDGPLAVRFEEPEHHYAPGHRGIDYAVPAGTRIRAAGPGVVRFAGTVGSIRAVTIEHASGYATTYSDLAAIDVRAGDEVGEGTWIGTSGSAHDGGIDGLHLGVKLNGRYVDPMALMTASDVGDAIHLAPLVWRPPTQMPDAFRSALADAGDAAAPCRPGRPLGGLPAIAPNENIAVAVAGLSSATEGGNVRAEMYRHGPEELGYSPDRIYRFSYSGLAGPRLHRPYGSRDTFGDIADASRRLQRLLVRIAQRHPGAKVDLLTHSMGGLVARHFLSTLAKQGKERLPRVEHLVTFSTPHQGAALAELPDSLDTKTLTGRWWVDGMSRWSRRYGTIPDPRSTAVGQMKPGSAFLQQMARESVVHGTRSLALAIPNDAVVTADRAGWDEVSRRVVPPSGLQGHAAIVASDAAQGLAYSFLRDAPLTCETAWDLWGPRVGRAVGFLEQQSYRGVVAGEELAIGRFLRAAKLGARLGRTRAGQVAGKAIGKLVHRTSVHVVNRQE